MHRSHAQRPRGAAPLLAAAVALWCSPSARAQERCPAPAPLLLDAERPSDPNRIEVSSDGAEVNSAGDAVLSGKVKVRQGDRVMTAEDARYDAAKQSFEVGGTVEYRDPLLRLSGESGTWSPTTGGTFGGAQFEIPSRPARGSADEITLQPDGRLGLKRVEYTSCPLGNRDWFLRADRIDIDQKEQQGTGRNVRLEFKGVPLLYSPVISFPVGDARKTGFLFPTFGSSSRNGFELAAPWYWNIAPNYDATLTPGIMSKRGATLGAQFRYLLGRSRGQIDADLVPSDEQTGTDRSLLRFTHTTDFAQRLRFEANVANASDSAWFEDFGLGPEGTSVLFLERVARLTYLDTHWRAVGLVQQFQTIDQTITDADRPYARLPQVVVRGRWGGSLGPGFTFRGEAVRFDREEGVTGSRFDLEPTVSWAWRRPGMFVVPSAGFRATSYSLEDQTTPDSSPTRTAPIATLDAGLVFERTGSRTLQTLEPRVLYTYIPYREQSDIPLFDTGLPDLNLVQLFRPERYVGGDRLGDANQVALGATTRLVEAASGRQLVEATLGQIYYFERPRVQLPGEPVQRTSTSDLIAQVMVSAYRNWNVQLGQQWNTQENRSVRSEIRVQYAPGGERVANLGYRFRRGLLEQVDGSFSWPLKDAWSLFARQVYSLRDKKSIESLAGLQYQACCWRVRIVGRRYVSDRTGRQDTGVTLQLELNGLSNVTESASAFLERSIRGYSPPAGAPGR